MEITDTQVKQLYLELFQKKKKINIQYLVFFTLVTFIKPVNIKNLNLPGIGTKGFGNIINISYELSKVTPFI